MYVYVATCSLKPGNTYVLAIVETVLGVGEGVEGVQDVWPVLILIEALTQCQ